MLRSRELISQGCLESSNDCIAFNFNRFKISQTNKKKLPQVEFGPLGGSWEDRSPRSQIFLLPDL